MYNFQKRKYVDAGKPESTKKIKKEEKCEVNQIVGTRCVILFYQLFHVVVKRIEIYLTNAGKYIYIFKSNCFISLCCHRISDGKLYFEIEWKGYKEYTWEKMENLTDCAESLDQFWEDVDKLWYA